MADNMAPASTPVTTDGHTAGTVDACPSTRALELVASKWALRIFPALENGPVRNNELLRRVGDGISQKMLTQTLRELEANGLILRTIHDSVPPHVEYRLSPLGASLNRTLVGLDDWVKAHWPEMERIRKNQVGSD
ncbi:PadR family transcriptional regulator [Ralstonia sp. A12]|uniref:winged helix-turn-helix transcriptional regulator n=1 Tax=Ralstonia sp. A12 TaxID=1217052 RepID=UPI0005730455|nr:helix-turn-helix domain-containing protein [Ralstonia sp. A12]KHK52844.1 PadR family transcriptional regulator [Ralstonia sp. A12]